MKEPTTRQPKGAGLQAPRPLCSPWPSRACNAQPNSACSAHGPAGPIVRWASIGARMCTAPTRMVHDMVHHGPREEMQSMPCVSIATVYKGKITIYSEDVCDPTKDKCAQARSNDFGWHANVIGQPGARCA